MTTNHGTAFNDDVERLQALLATLEGLSDAAARSAARELVRVVVGLHAIGLADLLAIVREAGSQPADTLLPKFLVNPRVRGLLLLHDMHPEDLETRVRKAVERLRPHLGVQGIRADLEAVEGGVVRIRATAIGQKIRRSPATQLRCEIEDAVTEMAPDATQIILEGLDSASLSQEAYVPLAEIRRTSRTGMAGLSAG